MTDTPRIIGHMVVGNELDRYLRHTIGWLQYLCDDVYIYDDHSTDGTYEWLRSKQIPCGQRSEAYPSFRQNESAFRNEAWVAMVEHHQPTTDEWILCIDADEFLLPGQRGADPRAALREVAYDATTIEHYTVRFSVEEIFAVADDGRLMHRIDGFWGQIDASRFTRFNPNALFVNKPEGGGSVPEYGWEMANYDMSIVHLGYLRAEDRQAKYERYRAGRGHNPRHIQSIKGTPTLKPWFGQPLPHGVLPWHGFHLPERLR